MMVEKHVNWELIGSTGLCAILTGLSYFVSQFMSDWIGSSMFGYFMYFFIIIGVLGVLWLILTGFRTTDSELVEHSIGSIDDISRAELYRNHPPIVNHDDPDGGFYSPIDFHRLSNDEMNFYHQTGKWW